MTAKSFSYKNISKRPQTVIGVGIVEAGATVTTAKEFNNPNFEQVTKESKK